MTTLSCATGDARKISGVENLAGTDMTTPERWKEIDRIFSAAVELKLDERAAFLNHACGADDELRQEVESMLAHDLPESLIGSQAIKEATQLLAPTHQQKLQNENIGPYQVIRSLGAGAMGHVYLAHDKRLNRPVAVKLLSFYDVTEEERIRRFRREALAASALNHPNILTIYEIGEADGHNFIAAEYVEGQTLLALISSGNVPVPTAVDIGVQIARALSAAHAAGIVHRDIKPANIMVRVDGLVKVLDFGIAKYSQPDDPRQSKESQVETAIGTVIGTAAYMSPEQARADAIDARTDIWSLGVILYELVTGHRPFEGETAMDVMSAVIERTPLTFSAHELVIPDALERIVSKALRKDRGERYQTINDMLLDLQSLKQELEFERKLESSMPPKSKSAADMRERATETVVESAVRPTVSEKGPTTATTLNQRSTVIAVAALLIIAAGVGSYFYFMRARSGVINSVAVLPFVNASGNSELEYLSDGLTESLITSLSQLPKLSVKARSSVFRYKGKNIEPLQVASELSVQAILNGRVVQRGDQLTLSLELVDARTGNQIWGEQYNRKLADLVALQQEIARDVSRKLQARLSGADKQKLAKNYTQNAEAYQAYLKGRYYWNKGRAPGYEKSRDYFQQAIDLDASYALAYSGLASYYSFAAANGLLPPDENWPKAEAAANKALALDETLAEPHNPMAAVKLYYYRDWPAAERYFRRGIELDPNFAEIHNHYALCLYLFGRNEEALTEIQRAIELEPLSPRFNLSRARILFFIRQYDRAIDQFGKTLELEPNFALAHEWLGYAYEQKGMHREAIAAWAKALTLSGEGEQASILERTYAASGFETAVRALAQRKLERLNEKTGRGEYVPASEYAMAYLRLGDKERVFGWLAKAVEETYRFALEIKVNPIFDSLRSDPRFADIVRRVGLPQ